LKLSSAGDGAYLARATGKSGTPRQTLKLRLTGQRADNVASLALGNRRMPQLLRVAVNRDREV